MSFTNVSLVPAEMLACGVIPVLGGSRLAKADLDNPFARWAEPSAAALAAELGSVISDPQQSATSVAESIRATSWKSAQRVVVETIEDEVYGQ
jgi:hypothetical protein